MDGAGQAKTTQTMLFGLEAWKADFDIFARFFLFHPAKEVGEGLVQIAQRFLRRTLGDCIQPGEFGLFQPIEFTVQVYRRRDLFAIRKGGLLARQSPVVSEACRTGMSDTGRLLLIVQIQLGFEGA